VPKPGRLFRNRALAETYRRLLAAAAGQGREAGIAAVRRAWSQGFVAAAIDRFCRGEPVIDSSGGRHRGVLTGDDMAGWEATIEAPLTLDYRGYTVAKCGPWSQGPVLLQLLGMLAHTDLDKMDPAGPDFVHTVVEGLKLAFADREAWYGDPAFVDVPVAALLSDGYAGSRAALIGAQASLALVPGAPEGRAPRLYEPGASQAAPAAGAGEPTTVRLGAGEPTTARLAGGPAAGGQGAEPRVFANGVAAGDTCHIDVVDRWGNMVSATPSGGWLQSSPVIPELGFCLGTRLQMCWLAEGYAASLAPGKRPRTTLTPSLALKGGEPYLAWGTPGGDQQEQWSALLFLHHVHHGMNLQEAIDAPAFHTEHAPGSFWPRQARPGHLALEGRFPSATVAELKRRGHRVELGEAWSEGRLSACAIERTDDGPILKAAANPRGMQGYAVGR
jgi:gamma-glutamyltranspeptidase/glutathione hydrolase